ncbi:hypothetical protein CTI12_AA530710 [Artemisia annua]|uniref:Uncharacterized protein n=1 Tax=Artemisia annua TaxID=35608 RepID=A0A2U1L4M0_ARTAN|nr:hypothetical protein CTI12_AA530710 [Artemisia annua]
MNSPVNQKQDSDELNSVSQDLDSFIKSFEEEISHPPENTTSGDRSSESGESRPEIEFLLEASDDELGLPPTESVVNEWVGLSELNWYDSFENDGFEYGDLNGGGFGVSDCNNNCEGEYEVLDGLFDYTDLGLPAQ